MIVKYKVTDFAKDTGLPVRKILDTLASLGVEGKKNSSPLEEKELNALLDRLSRDNSEADLSAFLNSGRPEPKPAPAKGSQPKGGKGQQNGQNGGAKQPQKAAQPAARQNGQQSAQSSQNAQQNQGGQEALLFRFHPLCICLSVLCFSFQHFLF